jgi:hypothetical protein
MLVTQIIGRCPACGGEASFGNVLVSGDVLVRGCLKCKHSEEHKLPALSKTVLYLDQCFLSHAFRGGLPEFVTVSRLIRTLAHEQLLVCPRSHIHEMETHLWAHPQQQSLWEFVKQTTRGHRFAREHRIKHRQILRAFNSFLTGNQGPQTVKASDAFSGNLNTWEDYFSGAVVHDPEDMEPARRSKQQAISQLVGLFPVWRSDPKGFEEAKREELLSAAQAYRDLYFKKMDRLEAGDAEAFCDAPVDSRIFESLLYRDHEIMEISDRLKRLDEFFRSAYFAAVPCEDISAGLFGAFRQRIKQGHYRSAEKAQEWLRGFYYDVRFIAAYAPYCNAMFLDGPMFDLVNEPRLQLQEKYGTRFFSKTNWDRFLEFLHSLEARKNGWTR